MGAPQSCPGGRGAVLEAGLGAGVVLGSAAARVRPHFYLTLTGGMPESTPGVCDRVWIEHGGRAGPGCACKQSGSVGDAAGDVKKSTQAGRTGGRFCSFRGQPVKRPSERALPAAYRSVAVASLTSDSKSSYTGRATNPSPE